MQNLIDRVFKNWKSTLIGITIISVSVIALLFDQATLEQVAIFWATGFGLFFVKDFKPNT